MTSSRTYGQRCGLALSLDLLGERWTLLIVRELARGPKRFRDLLDGLEGIGTNLLSARLKSLEEAGVVEKVTLPAPAEVPAHDLGPRGRTLEPILEDLALWGFETGEIEAKGLRTRAVWAAMSMRAQMVRSDSNPPDGNYAFEVGDEMFWLMVKDGESKLRDGAPPFEADVSVTMNGQAFFAVASGAAAPVEAGAAVEGDGPLLEELLESFQLPALPSAS